MDDREPGYGRAVTTVRCVVLGLLLAWSAREGYQRLAEAFPPFSAPIHTAIGLLLVVAVGVFCLRPMFLAYSTNSEQADPKRVRSPRTDSDRL